jgi:hypothetical protein
MNNLDSLLDDYDKLATKLPVVDCSNELKSLLQYEANLEEPIHRWFKFKESFSCRLIPHLLSEYFEHPKRRVAFLDPFCGVGTSLLAIEESLHERGVKEVALRGIEINPYLHYVATTKLAWDRYNPAYMIRAGKTALNGYALIKKPSLPELSTIKNERFVNRENLYELLCLREKIKVIASGRIERRPLLLGLAAATEKIFNLRKDGRALRYVKRSDEMSVKEEVFECWNAIAEDLQLGKRRGLSNYKVERGDGRRPDALYAHNRFDFIMFSPPYLNNIDYTEVYKVEAWLLEFFTSGRQMLQQRRRTFRSHPSCLFKTYTDASIDETIKVLGHPFKQFLHYSENPEPWRGRLFSQYFADMLRTLRGCSRLLDQNGRIFIIVGNSLHGRPEAPIPVAVDLWTCLLAKSAGLKVERLIIGRRFTRKKFTVPLLRESIIVLKKQ